MLKPVRSIVLVASVAVIGATAQPVAARTVAECYNSVLKSCADAMDGARFYERVAIGILCSAMLVGCNTSINL
jgi:hypothetical protein